jgi:hypothetical protein
MQPDFYERVKESVASGTSRAVVAQVEAGQRDSCSHCGEAVGFKARDKTPRVLCNVYVEQIWDHLEVYHPDCYVEAAAPYGPLLEGNIQIGSRKLVNDVIKAAAAVVTLRELSQVSDQ